MPDPGPLTGLNRYCCYTLHNDITQHTNSIIKHSLNTIRVCINIVSRPVVSADWITTHFYSCDHIHDNWCPKHYQWEGTFIPLLPSVPPLATGAKAVPGILQNKLRQQPGSPDLLATPRLGGDIIAEVEYNKRYHLLVCYFVSHVNLLFGVQVFFVFTTSSI